MPIAQSLNEICARPSPVRAGEGFYRRQAVLVDLGFHAHDLGPDVVEMELGRHAFQLPNFYVAQFAENLFMHMLVDDLPAWWRHFQTLNLANRYGVTPPQAPKREICGLDVAYLVDPSSVLWHIAQLPRQV
jgi:hypothetical protein